MADFGQKWCSLRFIFVILINFLLAFILVSAERSIKNDAFIRSGTADTGSEKKVPNQSGYQHVWPDMEFGWRIIVGTLIGFFGAAFGSVGGVGGGGIFVPMLSLVIGFDPKSSTAMSKCMIMGAAVSNCVL
ncbi:hypothetical protein ACOSP7_008286 [Xanthoceras sorbifolium]